MEDEYERIKKQLEISLKSQSSIDNVSQENANLNSQIVELKKEIANLRENISQKVCLYLLYILYILYIRVSEIVCLDIESGVPRMSFALREWSIPADKSIKDITQVSDLFHQTAFQSTQIR